MKNIFKRRIPEWLLYCMGVFWFACGIICCVTVIMIPLGVFGMLFGVSHFIIAIQQIHLKKKLKNLKIPNKQEDEPIITEPPKEKKLIK